MRGLMQDFPLTIDAIFRHVEQHYGDGTIVTNGPDGVTRVTYAEWAERTFWWNVVPSHCSQRFRLADVAVA